MTSTLPNPGNPTPRFDAGCPNPVTRQMDNAWRQMNNACGLNENAMRQERVTFFLAGQACRGQTEGVHGPKVLCAWAFQHSWTRCV